MNEQEIKREITEIGRRMYTRGFVAANDGNISCRCGDAVWTTPTGVSKGFMTEDMLVKTDLLGNVLVGSLLPSSELKMHLRVYRENPAVGAVTHAHPPIATAFAVMRRPLEKPILPEAVLQLGRVSVAPYATPGSEQVPESIAPFCRTCKGVLLANHGALTWGKDLQEAFFRLETMEHYASVLMYTERLEGEAGVLTAEQIAELVG